MCVVRLSVSITAIKKQQPAGFMTDVIISGETRLCHGGLVIKLKGTDTVKLSSKSVWRQLVKPTDSTGQLR